MRDNDLLTIEQVAQILNLHSKTIRRYINEGTINANKMGGQWRIKTEDLKRFMSGGDYCKSSREKEEESVKSFIEGKSSRVDGPIQVCTIIDVYVETVEEVKPICQALLDLMNSGDEDQKSARFQYSFIAEEKKGRFTLWGNPKFIAKMLNAVGDFM